MQNLSKTIVIHYSVHELTDYFNWIYFFHAWGFGPRFASIADIHGCDACQAHWLQKFSETEQPKAAEALRLFKEANKLLSQLDSDYRSHAVFRLCRANSIGDNLLLDEIVIPLLRQQRVKRVDDPYLCLSDFVRPIESGQSDMVGVFATTVDQALEQIEEQDPYRQMLLQVLAERIAEATAERLHEYVRKELWGYVPDEQLTIRQLLREEYQGIRPAIGYPSLPDQSISFLLDELLNMNQIGIHLTENGAMTPKASVCGLMIAHPEARYFSVGKIGNDQLQDYAARRRFTLEDARKFLAANLSS